MNRIPLWGILISLFLSCQKPENQEKPITNNTDIDVTDSIYRVSVVELMPSSFFYPIVAQGKVQALKSVELSFNTNGKIEQLFVKNGNYVRSGQLIARLYDRAQKIALEEAMINLKKSQLDFNKLLVDFSDSTRRKYWSKIREDLSLQAGLPQNKLQLQKARLNLDQTRLRAPFSGIVDGLEKSEESYISAFEKLGNLRSPQNYTVNIEVLEFDILRMRIGDSATVSPLFDQDISIRGFVSEIDPRVKENGYVSVSIEIPEVDNLLPGMSVNVTCQVAMERSLMVPKNAVVQKSGKPVIFTVEDQKAKWNYVTLGKDNGTHWQVLEGIKPNDKVVVDNNLQLAHDTRVKIENSN